MTDVRVNRALTPGSTAARRRLAAALSGVVLFILGYSSRTSIDTIDIASVAMPLLLVFCILRKKPKPAWPWWTMTLTTTLFAVGQVIRNHYETLGNLTRTRTIIPDLVFIPAYLLLATALAGFVIARTRSSKARLTIVYDALIAGQALFAFLYAFLIVPVLTRVDAPESVRLILGSYPGLSMFFVAVTIQLAFGSNRRRSDAERYLLLAMFFTFVGDVLTMLGEIHELTPTLAILVLPYTMAYWALANCALDPSMRLITAPTEEVRDNWPASRILLVALAFAASSVLIPLCINYSLDERLVIFALIVGLSGTAVLQIVQAMKVVRNSESLLKSLALQDSLTGLPNRRFLFDYLVNGGEGRTAGASEISILFLDLDRFKLINDTLGHVHGDRLLVEVSRRLQATVEKHDLVARIGGDEFVIVCPKLANVNAALEFANRVRNSLREPITLSDRDFVVSGSIGVAYRSLQPTEADVDLALRDADTAMYQAKDAGRDAVALFDDSMRARLDEEAELERDLRHAVRRHELHLVYQPIVSMAEHHVMGMEALIRWNHPRYGVLLPARFIPLAEESSLIISIGNWALEEAVRQVAVCRRLPGLESLSCSVNLSAKQLQDPSLVERVRDVLALNKVPGEALTLELTESAIVGDLEGGFATMMALRDLGIKLAIDDFGTAYASFTYLQRLPFDSLKLDRTFVMALFDDESSRPLVATILTMAAALHVGVVAEGVERVEEADELLEMGCDAAQGYLFARPVRAEQLSEVLQLLGSQNRAPIGDRILVDVS